MLATMRRMITGTTASLVLLTALVGCGSQMQAPGTRVAQGYGSSALDEPDLPLDRLPDEELVVPERPVRAPQPSTRGNDAKLYVSPAETLPALLDLVLSAKNSIYLETFNFCWESYGEKVAPLLIAKAKAGLDVRVVMDYVGSRFAPNHKAMVKMMRDAGVEVRIYRPRTIVKDDHRIGVNITHRKVYLADGKYALVGGVNLSKGFDTTTQDALIGWRGPVVGQLYQEFRHDWLEAGGSPLRQTVLAATNTGTVEAQVILTSPGEGRFDAKEVILRQLDSAQREILIEQQYITDDVVIDHLHDALRRGVKVRLIAPEVSHGGIFTNLHAAELNRLVKEGAEARLFRGNPADAHLHAKYLNVDDRWTMCGSINFDTRALIENQELAVSFTDRALVLSMRQRLFERDWAMQSQPFEYTAGNWVIKPVRTLLELIDYYI